MSRHSISRPQARGLRAAAFLFAAAALSGCRQDMHDAPRYDPLASSTVLPKGSSAQPLVEGTVPREVRVLDRETLGGLREDDHLYTGKVNGEIATTFPFAITAADLDQGQERFNIYCAPCHGRTGDGNGMVVQRGFRQPPSYHIDRLRQVPVGYLFGVITIGFATMPDYSAQIPVEDRWRIVAYMRALQLSHNAKTGELSADDMKKLQAASEPAPSSPERKEGKERQ
jgi:mono/diheme cytochrome c family protein